MNQRLLRFDIRLPPEAYVDSFWDSENRARFLLQPEISWPLSVDPLVWPSVFYSDIFRKVNKLPYGSIEVDPAIDGGNYWLDLGRMKDHYERHRKSNTRGVPIGVHLISERSLAEDIIPYTLRDGARCAMTLGHTNPSELPPDGVFLGFDIADASGISGLTNCGYSFEDKQRLSSKWSERLNEFGLLKTVQDALEFRDISDKRVEEHSPFWIYGLSKLPSGGDPSLMTVSMSPKLRQNL